MKRVDIYYLILLSGIAAVNNGENKTGTREPRRLARSTTKVGF